MHLETIQRSIDPWFLDFENRNEKKTTAATSFFDWTLVQQLTGELSLVTELGKVMEISQVIEHVQEIQQDQVKAKKQVKLWSSEAFFTTTPKEFGFEQSKIELDLGIRTFFDEYALLNPRKKYTKYGNKGWKNQNSVRTKISCERFVESLKKQKMNPVRAQLEVWAAGACERFLSDSTIDPGSILIMISPRGSVEEGYPGEDPANYFFINVYIKEDDTHATLHQFTSYALMPQLLETHSILSAQKSTRSSSKNSTNKFLPTLPNAFSDKKTGEPILDSHWVITNPILIKPQDTRLLPEEMLTFIDHELYKNQDGWEVCIADLPEINIDLYTKKAEELIAEILIIFDELAQVKLANGAESACESEQDRQRTQFNCDDTTLIAEFDSLISLSRRYLLKWVEQNARNYGHNYSEAEKQTYPDVKSFITSWKETSFVYANLVVTHANLANLTTISTSGAKNDIANNGGNGVSGNGVSSHASITSLTSLERSFQLSSSKLIKVSSAAHCVVGTPGATAIQAENTTSKTTQNSNGKIDIATKSKTQEIQTKNRQKMMKNISVQEYLQQNQDFLFANIHDISPGNPRVEQVQNWQKKYRELVKIQTNVFPILIENLQTQRQETIYIWFLDPSLAPQYEPGCYRKNSGDVVYGPCHVDLEDDELLASFEYSGKHQRYLEQSQYFNLGEQIFELQMKLVIEIALLVNEENLEVANNTKGTNKHLTKEEEEKSQKIVSLLSRRIFRVTFSDLVAGFAGTPLLSYTVDVLSLPRKCSEFLTSFGPNKFEGVRELIAILESEELSEISNALQIPHQATQLAA